MPNFDFIQESPVSGVGFVYKSSTSAFYYDGTTSYPIRQTATFTATTGSGTTTLTISAVTSGSIAVGMDITGLSGTARIIAFGTFNGVSGTVTLATSRTWTNPTSVTAVYSFNKAAEFTVTTGSGTDTVNISVVASGTVAVGQQVRGLGNVYRTISSFGTFTVIAGSGTIVLNGTVTFTNPTAATSGILVA